MRKNFDQRTTIGDNYKCTFSSVAFLILVAAVLLPYFLDRRMVKLYQLAASCDSVFHDIAISYK